MTISEKIAKFLEAQTFGVVGASVDREKYGNKVFRCYQMKGLNAVPVNPKEKVIEGVACVASVTELPELPEGAVSLSVITPPEITEKIVDEAVAKGIKNIWMQPGAQSTLAVEKCVKAGINVIADGSCILVVLGFREH